MLKTIVKLKNISLFGGEDYEYNFPQTRYQGSKLKLINWIKSNVEHLEFETVLDIFGGTGSVSYLFKTMGKKVTFNDNLGFNSVIAKALIQNNSITLDEIDLKYIFNKHNNIKYTNIIQNNFKDIYFTDEENKLLDVLVSNIESIGDEYKRAIAYFALFQSCIIKRPYNLFHRKNLYVRMSDVKRSFGNKKTWDTPFEKHFVKFVKQANEAIFSNGNEHRIFNCDALLVPSNNYDLVYIDPPYISNTGTGVNYFEFYHFLEGLINYKDWFNMIDFDSKNNKLKSVQNPWNDKNLINSAFEDLFKKYQKSTLVISYRDDGIPSIEDLEKILITLGKKVEILTCDYRYVLSTKNIKEVLIIAR